MTTIKGFISTTKEHFEEALYVGIYNEMRQDFLDKINNFVAKIKDALALKSLPFNSSLMILLIIPLLRTHLLHNTDSYSKIKFYDRIKELADTIGYGIQMDKKENNENADKAKDNENTDDNKNTEFVKEKKDQIIIENSKIPKYYYNREQFKVYKSDSKLSTHLMDFIQSIEKKDIKEEALKFETECFCCNLPGEAYTCVCTIPYFK